MPEDVYTLAGWRVQPGREAEFIEAWKAMGGVFRSLNHPPLGKGTLVQSTSEPSLFYSFGSWRSFDDIQAMRDNPHAQQAMQRLRELCTEARPGSFRVVAEA